MEPEYDLKRGIQFFAPIRPRPDSFADVLEPRLGYVEVASEDWQDSCPTFRVLQAQLGQVLDGHGPGSRSVKHTQLSNRPILKLFEDLVYLLFGMIGGHGSRYQLGMRAGSSVFDSISATDIYRQYKANLAEKDAKGCGGRQSPAESKTHPTGVGCIHIAASASAYHPQHRVASWTDVSVQHHIVEGLFNRAPGPFNGRATEKALDIAKFNSLTTAQQAAVLAQMTVDLPGGTLQTHDGKVPRGYALYAQPHLKPTIDQALHDEMSEATRFWLVKTVFQLHASFTRFGTVFATVMVGPKFVRLYVLGTNRIAIELADARPPGSRIPLFLETVPYSALEVSTLYDRLPWNLTRGREMKYRSPFPSTKPVITNEQRIDEEYDAVDEEEMGDIHTEGGFDPTYDMGDILSPLPRIDLQALQTLINFQTAAVKRAASCDSSVRYVSMPTPLQDKHDASANAATRNAILAASDDRGIPRELSTVIADMATAKEPLGTEMDREYALASMYSEEEDLVDLDALECTVANTVRFVLVTQNEMDELVDDQLLSDTGDESPHDINGRFRTFLDVYHSRRWPPVGSYRSLYL